MPPSRYRAVLLDFRGILVHSPDLDWWISEALRRLGRTMKDGELAEAREALARIPDQPGYDADEVRVDISVDVNHEVTMRRLLGVGIDAELAEALWALDFDASAWPVFPDAPMVVQEIRNRGVATALVSDFHADLRPHLSAHGIELDAYVISFEHGFQKPDPRMFATALDQLDVGARDALMVGDRPSHDGGAAIVGIDTMILPAPTTYGPRGLDVILRLL
jgi:HAD superfamily hydrolase (TIGR01549 family)